MYKTVVFQGEELLGEVEIYPEENFNDLKEIRINGFSQPSERCPPLGVLHTVAADGICFKMESKSSFSQDSPLHLLHSSCIRDNKTAVIARGEEDIHLVAMHARSDERNYPCFWGFIIPSGLYDSCLIMLNLRCLGIVFDLDETLIVANTMRSFDTKIEALQWKISTEVDPQRIPAMLAEVSRYQDDKTILKQYIDGDQVLENGKVIKIQSEVVPALSGNHQSMIRPLIRLQEKNIILTRINPLIRDTSVLVRLRPAWEDLRSYLTARGRKRFEVYVCTMAERDYALEMWRLLDPDANLISTKELLDRVVCVKAGLRKSLFNVFQDGQCHPKMALVIDDRLKVWEERDQPRVHVVPAFAPYYAPQSEANNAVPVLCVARNVACNVRGGFFKDFDEGLLQRIPEVAYEDDFRYIPPPPDVSNYLVSEDDASASNGNKDPVGLEGLGDVEVERRLKDAIAASSAAPMMTSLDPRRVPPPQYTVISSSPMPISTLQASIMPFPNMQFPQIPSLVRPLGHVSPPEPILQSSPAREEGEVPESELDPDTRRRLLILQHGQDTRDHVSAEPPFPVRPPIQASGPQVHSRGSWFPAEEEMSPRQLNQVAAEEFPLDSEPVHFENKRPPFFKVDSSIPSDRILHESQRLPKEGLHRDDRLRKNHPRSTYHSLSGEEMSLSRSPPRNRDIEFESGQDVQYAETLAGTLQEIAMKCGAKVEFRSALVASSELQLSTEVWFAGEKVGEGIGRTRREAQRLAAESSIKKLAGIYLSRGKPDSNSLNGEEKLSDLIDFGNVNYFGNQPLSKESMLFSTAADPSRFLDPRLEGSKSVGSVSALKELCMMEGLDVVFRKELSPSANSMQKDEVHAQVEIDGQVLGNGTGLTWNDAKIQAAEKALGSLRQMLGQQTQKRQDSPRSLQGMPNKRSKLEYSRPVQRMPSAARYPKNAPVP